jgi:hypothetical protein
VGERPDQAAEPGQSPSSVSSLEGGRIDGGREGRVKGGGDVTLGGMKWLRYM